MVSPCPSKMRVRIEKSAKSTALVPNSVVKSGVMRPFSRDSWQHIDFGQFGIGLLGDMAEWHYFGILAALFSIALNCILR
jgi:hypothetical protein